MQRSFLAAGLASLIVLSSFTPSHGADRVVQIRAIAEMGQGAWLGTIALFEVPNGVLMEFDLADLTPGQSYVYLADTASCLELAAGTRLQALTVQGVDVDEEEGADRLLSAVVVAEFELHEMTGKAILLQSKAAPQSMRLEPLDRRHQLACGVVN